MDICRRLSITERDDGNQGRRIAAATRKRPNQNTRRTHGPASGQRGPRVQPHCRQMHARFAAACESDGAFEERPCTHSESACGICRCPPSSTLLSSHEGTTAHPPSRTTSRHRQGHKRTHEKPRERKSHRKACARSRHGETLTSPECGDARDRPRALPRRCVLVAMPAGSQTADA